VPTPKERAQWKSVVDNHILKAKTGDRDSALWLMGEYVRALQNSAIPIREIIQFFGEAFRDILEYEAEGRCTPAVIAESLCLERPNNRPQGAQKMSETEIFYSPLWCWKREAEWIQISTPLILSRRG